MIKWKYINLEEFIDLIKALIKTEIIEIVVLMDNNLI